MVVLQASGMALRNGLPGRIVEVQNSEDSTDIEDAGTLSEQRVPQSQQWQGPDAQTKLDSNLLWHWFIQM